MTDRSTAQSGHAEPTTHDDALRAYIAATNTHDFARIRRLLHAEAVFWFSDADCDSPETVRSYFENAWRVVENEVYAATDVRWVAVGADAAACVYTYTYEGHRGGAYVTGRGRATNVFAKDENGRWQLVHEHLSPETRPR